MMNSALRDRTRPCDRHNDPPPITSSRREIELTAIGIVLYNSYCATRFLIPPCRRRGTAGARLPPEMAVLSRKKAIQSMMSHGFALAIVFATVVWIAEWAVG